uniref:RRM domain-containing protein n=1 Tax=Timema douglasi TaxID=61478 RepID=A0A7R8VDK4_TIMDO|nr:unnamed protein product [Timema douglasi]
MSRYRDSGSSECKLYVGDLDRGGRSSGSAASKQELEEAFSYYGPLRNVWVARNPPGFAFVEFEDPRDAEDAVRGLDAQSVAVACEWSRPMEWVEKAADSEVRHLAGGDLSTLRTGATSVVNGATMPETATVTAAVEVVVGGPILVQGQGHALEIVARVLAQPPVHDPGTGAALSHVHLGTGPEHPRTGQGPAVLVSAPAPETALAQPTPTAAQRPVRGAGPESLPTGTGTLRTMVEIKRRHHLHTFLVSYLKNYKMAASQSMEAVKVQVKEHVIQCDSTKL